MTSRIDAVFARLRDQGRTAVIPYIACGDPFADATVDIMLALAQGGADVIELGVPFSDPMADGPVIQKASERALARGIGTPQVLAAVRAFRSRDAATPVVLMGYANPVEAYDLAHGKGAFVRAAAEAGVDGVLVVDYPPEESVEFSAALKAAGLAPIFLLAPTSTEKRMRQVGEVAAGYVYYVSLKGVTGAGHLDTEAVARAVPRIKEHVKVPVGVVKAELVDLLDPAQAKLGKGEDGRPVLAEIETAKRIAPKNGVCTIEIGPYGCVLLTETAQKN